MKRVLFLIVLCLIFNIAVASPANAGYIADKKAQIQNTKLEKSYKKEIKELFDRQEQYAKKYDMKALKSLYSDSFIDNDGYNKDVYFSLIEETWETYPDITYTTEIKNIKINGRYAIVETFETAVATADDKDKELIGELYSESKCRYYLQRFSNKWEFTAEEVLEEFSTLKYGGARFVDMYIESPTLVGAGQSYTSTLKVDLPSDYVVIASINQEKIINPAEKPEETYKRLDDEQTLARMFVANTDNVNEYTVAAVGITSANVNDSGKVNVYMNGLAFVMSRVNVVPKNNFARVNEKSKEEI